MAEHCGDSPPALVRARTDVGDYITSLTHGSSYTTYEGSAHSSVLVCSRLLLKKKVCTRTKSKEERLQAKAEPPWV